MFDFEPPPSGSPQSSSIPLDLHSSYAYFCDMNGTTECSYSTPPPHPGKIKENFQKIQPIISTIFLRWCERSEGKRGKKSQKLIIMKNKYKFWYLTPKATILRKLEFVWNKIHENGKRHTESLHPPPLHPLQRLHFRTYKRSSWFHFEVYLRQYKFKEEFDFSLETWFFN